MAKTLAERTTQVRHDDPRFAARQRRKPWSSLALGANALLVYVFLYAPIIILVLFSFNQAKFGTRWEGWTLEWYQALWQSEKLQAAAWTSIQVATISTLVATVIGTLAALALAKRGWVGRRTFDSTLYFPVIIPDIVLAVALLGYFTLTFRQLQNLLGLDLRLGLTTVIIAHIAFNISYVALVVRASLANFDPRFEEAAADLGATPLQVFWRIKFPLILPGSIGGALMAFTLSLDDFVITFFARGPGVNTLTTEVYGRIKRFVSPEINAISTVMLAISIMLVSASLLMQRRQV